MFLIYYDCFDNLNAPLNLHTDCRPAGHHLLIYIKLLILKKIIGVVAQYFILNLLNLHIVCGRVSVGSSFSKIVLLIELG